MAAPQQPPQAQPAQLTLLQAQVGPPSGGGAAAGGGHPGSAQAAAGAASLTVGQAPGGLQPPAQAQDFDPVQRFRLLLPQLKESLQSLMKVAAQNFIQNTNIDSGQKSNDGPVQRVDKSLEEFYALCDQLELCLRLAYECLSQSFDSAKHSPTLVPTATKPDAVQAESLPYTQYLSMIKSQISCAKDIHNALLECSNKITGKAPSQGVL
ncbi:mediator of RNA polymerase II transcription subunit 29 [Podarcis muralis]|uniref:Mediator of RNA polymerase II transcription subunit 29 n=2 Tax=Podarcis TaxID=42163 RepID=A0AA35PCB1_9SAUR|nr:mediator of RNA polymerase II transcription subunit 29 [Podarcis raffonei]CAI5780670.1 mediator of RNA polymerase II transcription subunit 29 [Podarcis lilfordi]